MSYLILFISGFLGSFLIWCFRATLYNLAENSVSLLDKLLAQVNEDEKILIVQKATNKLLLTLLKFILLITVVFGVYALPILLYKEIVNPNFNAFSLVSVGVFSIGASLPFFLLKTKLAAGYSELSVLLHKIALNNYNIALKLFALESKKIHKIPKEQQEFVVISGLARAGTTSLMNNLSTTNHYVSLNYANMPFILSPNIWRKFYNPKSSEKKERSHKDGIMVGLDSNEALEEFFFKAMSKDSYIKEKLLIKYELPQEHYYDYLKYQEIIKNNSKKIYLAKNNNFIIRYNAVRTYNENFKMVILFREPLSHSASLLEKHKQYCKMQKEEPFVLEYMNWLGHHEFGLNQKQFCFYNQQKIIDGNRNELDYWLKIWINYYKYALSIKDKNTFFVSYEEYCANPNIIVNKLLNVSGLENSLTKLSSFQNNRKVSYNYTNELLDSAKKIYNQLALNAIK